MYGCAGDIVPRPPVFGDGSSVMIFLCRCFFSWQMSYIIGRATHSACTRYNSGNYSWIIACAVVCISPVTGTAPWFQLVLCVTIRFVSNVFSLSYCQTRFAWVKTGHDSKMVLLKNVPLNRSLGVRDTSMVYCFQMIFKFQNKIYFILTYKLLI